MNFWDLITGNDMTQAFNNFEMRVKNLPADYQAAWEEIDDNLWEHADFTGRNLMPILEGVLGLFEESVAQGQPVQAVLGDNLGDFCAALAEEEGVKSLHKKWRNQLNSKIAQKLEKHESSMFQDLIAGKKKWRAHMARVKALPQDYQIVYKEIQKYIFKASSLELNDGTDLLSGIIDLFEEGAASGKSVREVTGKDVAAFCDGLLAA